MRQSSRSYELLAAMLNQCDCNTLSSACHTGLVPRMVGSGRGFYYITPWFGTVDSVTNSSEMKHDVWCDMHRITTYISRVQPSAKNRGSSICRSVNLLLVSEEIIITMTACLYLFSVFMTMQSSFVWVYACIYLNICVELISYMRAHTSIHNVDAFVMLVTVFRVWRLLLRW